MKDTLPLLSSKVWDLETAKTPIVDIPETGFDYSMINKHPEGYSFTGRHYDGSYATYTILNGDFKKVNLIT